MSPTLIGFAGAAGAGKSSAALHLVSSFGFTRVRFAGPLKAMMAALGLSEREIDGDLKEAPCPLLGGRTPRHAMQTMGTEWGRDLIDPDLWIRAWGRAVDDHRRKGCPVVVDDVRFANEAAAIRARGGLLVRIERPGLASALSAHASELQSFEADARLPNDGDLGALLRQAADLCDSQCRGMLIIPCTSSAISESVSTLG